MLKKIFSFIIFLFLTVGILTLVVSFFLTNRSSFFGKATQGIVDSEVSIENSYLFASPLTAESGNRENIRVTVFILDSQGLGVGAKSVVLDIDPTLTVTPIQNPTDSYGKAVFDVSSQASGLYEIRAKLDEGGVINQSVKVTFR